MDNDIILYKPYYKKNGRSIKRSDYYTVNGARTQCSMAELYVLISEGSTIVVDKKNIHNNKYYKHHLKTFKEVNLYLGMLKTRIEDEVRCTKLLHRIIANGGFVEYIKKLE